MRIPRFHAASLDASEIVLDARESRHAREVLRLDRGDRVLLFDGSGAEALCEIVEPGNPMRLRRIGDSQVRRALSVETLCACACPKGSRLDFMVAKLAELGLSRFVPLRTRRGVVSPGPAKLARLARIALESAKQCGRADSLEIAPEATLAEILKTAGSDPVFYGVPGEKRTFLAALPDLGRPAPPARILYLVGPEGGWFSAEEEALRGSLAVPVSLGPMILRVETAALAFQSVLAQFYGKA